MSISPIIEPRTLGDIPSLTAQTVLTIPDCDNIEGKNIPLELKEYIADFQKQIQALSNGSNHIYFKNKLFEIPEKSIYEDRQYDFINCFYMLQNKGLLNRDQFLQLQFFEAVKNKNINLVKELLLERCIDINARDNHNRTALSIAIANDDFVMTELLLQNEADSNKQFDINFIDVICKDPELLSFFEKEITDEMEKQTITPVMLASAHGYSGIIKILLKYGASLTQMNVYSPIGLKSSFMHLWLAVNNEKIEAIEIILKNSTFGDIVEIMKARHVAFALKKEKITHIIDEKLKQFIPEFEFSPTIDTLTLAIELGNIDLVEELLDEKIIGINDKNNNNRTALLKAVSSGNFAITKLLIDNGADVSIAHNGWTHELLLEDLKITELIFQKDPSIANFTDDSLGTTLLLREIDTNNNIEHLRQLVQLLLKYGDKDIIDKQSKYYIPQATALNLAVRKGQKEKCKILLENGANPNIKNQNGQTALMELKLFAELNKDSIFDKKTQREFVQLFLDYGKGIDTSCEVIQEFLPTLPDEYKTRYLKSFNE